MSSTVDGPVTVSPEAAARVAELGLQREFEQIVEHTRQTIPGLRRLEVTLAPAHDTGDDPASSSMPSCPGPNPFSTRHSTAGAIGSWPLFRRTCGGTSCS